GGIGSPYGTIFKLTPAGIETVLHAFNGVEGAGPEGRLIADATGNLYGTTSYGGPNFYGTVFKLTLHPDGTYSHSSLHDFAGSPGDGAQPYGLLADSAGNLYVATNGGGPGWCGGPGCGTVVRLAPNQDGTYTESVLHSFTADNPVPSGFGGSD